MVEDSTESKTVSAHVYRALQRQRDQYGEEIERLKKIIVELRERHCGHAQLMDLETRDYNHSQQWKDWDERYDAETKGMIGP